MFKHKDIIKFSEVDQDKKLGIRGIINYFQDVSELQSESMGTGFLKLDKNRYGWIINSWQIQIKRRPTIGEVIYSATSPHKIKGIEGDRNFFILDENENVLVNANSIWSFFDRDKKTLMRVPKSELEVFKLYDPYPMEYEPRRINVRNIDQSMILPDGEVKVRYSMIDSNGHVNNERYAELACDYLRRDYKYDQLRVEYSKMALEDDVIYIRHYEDNERYVVFLQNDQGENFAICEFKEI